MQEMSLHFIPSEVHGGDPDSIAILGDEVIVFVLEEVVVFSGGRVEP